MLSRRPLLYLTIPSLALLIGLWFRRKKALAAAAGRDKPTKAPSQADTRAAAVQQQTERLRGRRDISESVPIGSSSDDDGSLLNNSGGSINQSVGGITGSGPNSRSPPIPIANKPGCGGHTSDELNSVDEFEVGSSVSPVDLPGSYERRNYQFVKNSHLYNKRTKGSMDVPVKVITASKSPKISPKNAFGEATSTSTPAPKQKTPKRGEDSLILQSQMAKLSLDDDDYGDNEEEDVAQEHVLSKSGVGKTNASPATTAAAKKAVQTTNSTQEQQQQQQPPSVNSPPLSLYSVHSSDSGQGASPVQSEAATAAGEETSQDNCYEFLVHEKYVGMLIGRGGAIVKSLHKRFNVHMIVRRVPNCPRPTDRVCAIMGAASDINEALTLIRQLAANKCPELSLERVYYASTPVPSLGVKETVVFKPVKVPKGARKPVMPIHYPIAPLPQGLSLVEGINNDVVISAILNGGHVFLQQQSHPTFQQLQAMYTAMAQSYEAGDSPVLEELRRDSVCVAPVSGIWYRMVIISSHETDGQKMCLVKFLDYGGFVVVPAADIRQIRKDFMALPFQSIECVLSNVRAIGGEEWSQEAADLVFQLSQGRVLQAQVAGYTVDGLPEVFLYATLGPDNIAFINQELVAQGFAEWMQDDDEEQQEVTAH